MTDKQAVPKLMPDSIPLSLFLAKKYGICGALLIQQLHFRLCTKGSNKKNTIWFYNSYPDWAKELGGLYTAWTVQQTIRKLEEDGVVKSDNFNQKGYDRTKWYTLDYDKLGDLRGKLEEQKNQSPSLENPEDPLLKIKSPIPENKEEMKTETLAKASPSQPAAPLLKKPAGKKIVITKGPSSAKQILHNLQVQQGKAPSVKPNSTASLHSIWRTVPKFNEGIEFMAELTLRQRGGLSYIAKSWGPTADSNLKYLIQHWIAFTKFVAGQKGIKNTPNVPSIEFLQKYVGEAASFVLQQSVQSIALPVTAKPVSGKLLSTPVKNKATPAPAPKVPKPSPSVDSADEVASLDDVLKWKPKEKD